VNAEGDLDFRGTLGVAKDAAVGFKTIASASRSTRDAPPEQLDKLLTLTERSCVVLPDAQGHAATSVSIASPQRRSS